MKIRKDRLFILCSFIFLGSLFLIYASRFAYFFITEKTRTGVNTVTFNEYLIKSKLDNLYKINDKYIFKGKNIDNYVYYSGILYRIVSIDKDKQIKLITDENITSLVWGYDNNYENSYVNKWLNDMNEENTGIFVKSLNSYSKYIINTKTCIDNGESNTKCSKYNEDYLIGLLSIDEYNAAGEDSYLNNGTYWWLSNNDGDKAWYVTDKGKLSNDSYDKNSYYGYGVRPTITLNKDIVVSEGIGTKNNPYIFTINENKVLLNKDIGSYLEYNNYIWRIVSKTESSVKIAMTEYVKPVNEQIISFSKVSNIYNKNSLIGGYLNKTYYKTLNNEDYLVEGIWHYGDYNKNNKYDYQDIYENKVTAKLGLLTIGDMFLADVPEVFTTGIGLKNTISTITKYGNLTESSIKLELKIRPAAYLNGKLNVTGKGTINDPLKLGMEGVE